VQALGTIGPKAKAKVPILIVSLSDPDLNVQASAIWAVGRMEAAAVNALPILEKIAADPNLPAPFALRTRLGILAARSFALRAGDRDSDRQGF